MTNQQFHKMSVDELETSDYMRDHRLRLLPAFVMIVSGIVTATTIFIFILALFAWLGG